MPNRQELASQLSRLGLALQATSGSPTIANRAQTSLDRLGQNDARLLEQQLQNEAALGLSRERSETDFQNRLFLQDRRADQTQRNAFKNKLIDLTFGAVKDHYDMLGELANSHDTDPEMKPAIRKQRDEMGQLLFNPQNMEKFVDGLSQDRELMESLLQTPEGGGALATKGSGSEIVNQNTGEVVAPAKAVAGSADLTPVTVVTPDGRRVSGFRSDPRIAQAFTEGGEVTNPGDTFKLRERERLQGAVDAATNTLAEKMQLPPDHPDLFKAAADAGNLNGLKSSLEAQLALKQQEQGMSKQAVDDIMKPINRRMSSLAELVSGVKQYDAVMGNQPAALLRGKQWLSKLATKMDSFFNNIVTNTDDKKEIRRILANPKKGEEEALKNEVAAIAGGVKNAEQLTLGIAAAYARAAGLVSTNRIPVETFRLALGVIDKDAFNGNFNVMRGALQTIVTQAEQGIIASIAPHLGGAIDTNLFPTKAEQKARDENNLTDAELINLRAERLRKERQR